MIRPGHMMNMNFSSAPIPIHNYVKSRVEHNRVEYVYDFIRRWFGT
jgi:hypothetical protein